MPRLANAFRTVAKTADHLYGDNGAVSIQRLGQATSKSHDATVYSERVSWRRDPNSHSGDRLRIYERMVRLDASIEDVPVGSYATVGTLNYTVEASKRATASSAQVLTLTRAAVEQHSRPNAWE